jgi:autotransporter-associated beta strand protein
LSDNDFFNLSQRYDDPYFVQNINRATTAGMLAGSYHFARADVLASTVNSDGATTAGVANNGADEADHFIQMAGAWMRPGYLLPVLDLEAGAAQRSTTALSLFAIEFSDRVYERTGVRPMIYVNSSYANSEVNSTVAASMPHLWIARPSSGDPLTTEPPPALPAYPNVYGVWNPSYPTIPTPQPWRFWQYNTTTPLNGHSGAIDKNAANGGIEFVKDYLVPAMWMSDSNGQWTTITNWNSGQTPIAPVTGPGQLTPIGTQTLPAARLPGSNDTVTLERSGTDVTVTLASGTHNIRKLYVRETLNITGGSLTVNHVPSPDSTPIAAQFSAPVTLSGSGSLSVHTLQVDATRIFALGGGTVTFDTIELMPHSVTPAKITLSGNVNFNPLANVTSTVGRGAGSGSSGLIDLGGAARSFNVGNGSAEVDLSLDVPVINGGLTKTGAGTMRLNSVSAYGGGTILSAGRLLVNNTSGSGTGGGSVVVNGGTLGGTGSIAGAVTVNSGGTIMPGSVSSIGRLSLNSGPTFNGTNFMRINPNGGSPLADRLVLTAGTMSYGGSLVISNAGAALVGGEVFTNFVAPAYSGAFANIIAPSLSGGLNWYTGRLAVDGTILINRLPVASQAVFTYEAPHVLQIPIASLASNATDADGDPIIVSSVSLTTSNGVSITTNDAFIFYSNFVSVADQFTYTVNDGRGGSATGLVRIASSPAGRFTGHPSLNGASVTLDFAGQPGRTYHVERSTNLPVWVTVSTNVAPANGIFDYTDDFQALTPSSSPVFYRLRWSP